MLLLALLLLVIGAAIVIVPALRQVQPLGWLVIVLGLVLFVVALAGTGDLSLGDERGLLVPGLMLGLRRRLRLT